MVTFLFERDRLLLPRPRLFQRRGQPDRPSPAGGSAAAMYPSAAARRVPGVRMPRPGLAVRVFGGLVLLVLPLLLPSAAPVP